MHEILNYVELIALIFDVNKLDSKKLKIFHHKVKNTDEFY